MPSGTLFRFSWQNDDQDEVRHKSTLDKEIMEHNRDRFLERWVDILSNPLTKTTIAEIENLHNHIRKGLSNIPLGYGTERNEQLHRLLNRSLISGATRVSIELATALLTIIFYYHNKKASASNHSCNKRVKPVVPIDAAIYSENTRKTSE